MKFQVFPENSDVTPRKRVKFGIDPTFPRLHLGHLVPLRLVKKMKADGHDVTIVLGTFTAQLGDPSGREKARPILSEDEVLQNASHITVQVRKLLGQDIQLFANGEAAFNQMTVPDMMLLASKFTVQQALSRDSFQKRLTDKQPLGLHELFVPILQGWDSVALKTEIEIGGQDQLFNFQVARQLQEAWGQKPQTCILLPIISGTDGRKMSKSLGNCIFLDETPDDMFGKVMSIPDTVMEEWFPLFCDFTVEDTHPMDKKKMLATEIVAQTHSLEVAWKAGETFVANIQNKEVPQDIPTIPASTILEAVVGMTGLSKTAARQRLKEGGVRVDGNKVFDEKLQLSAGQLVQGGKRCFAKVG
jgi:tyrosyl-tRNA synthetase